MSTFGDGTAKQELLDSCRYIRAEYNLSLMALIHILAEVIAYMAAMAIEVEEEN